MSPLLPSLSVTPAAVTVLFAPAFLSVNAKLPPLSVSVLYSVPAVTCAVPAALSRPSYVLLTAVLDTVRSAFVMLATFVPPTKV